jgi:hypothetical protein
MRSLITSRGRLGACPQDFFEKMKAVGAFRRHLGPQILENILILIIKMLFIWIAGSLRRLVIMSAASVMPN